MSTAPSTRVSRLFNNRDADLILQSEDGVYFYIDLPILAAASSVFKNMSTLPQPTPQSDKEPVDERIVPMQETSATLELLLWLIHPGVRSKFTNPDLLPVQLKRFSDVLAAADKYHMPKVAPTLDILLNKPQTFEGGLSAFYAFAMASRHDMPSLAQSAAKAMLALPPPYQLFAKAPQELENVPAIAYHKLLEYRERCLMVLPPRNREDFRSSRPEHWSEVAEWGAVNRKGQTIQPVWKTCPRCKRSGQVVAYWFIDHVQRIQEEFSRSVSAKTVRSESLLYDTLTSIPCSDGPPKYAVCKCREKAPAQLVAWGLFLSINVEAKLNQVR